MMQHVVVAGAGTAAAGAGSATATATAVAAATPTATAGATAALATLGTRSTLLRCGGLADGRFPIVGRALWGDRTVRERQFPLPGGGGFDDGLPLF